MSLTAIGVGMAALAGKIRSTLLIGAALAEATAIYGFVLGILIILMVK